MPFYGHNNGIWELQTVLYLVWTDHFVSEKKERISNQIIYLFKLKTRMKFAYSYQFKMIDDILIRLYFIVAFKV